MNIDSVKHKDTHYTVSSSDESIRDSRLKVGSVAIRALKNLVNTKMRVGILVVSLLLLGYVVQGAYAKSCYPGCSSECIKGLTSIKPHIHVLEGHYSSWYQGQVKSCQIACCTEANSYSKECINECIKGLKRLIPYIHVSEGQYSSWYQGQIKSCVNECSWKKELFSCDPECVQECIAGVKGLIGNSKLIISEGQYSNWYHKQIKSCVNTCCSRDSL